MDYEQAITYLYSLRKTGIKLRLPHTQYILHHMEDPHMMFKSVHVGGTNGKGSVCAMISSVLTQAGYRVGLYTSPHLVEFTERIQVTEVDIPKEALAMMLTQMLPLINEMRSDESLGEPSFFEVVTSLAFKYFAENSVDLAVVEVGLGGRLDSTNVLSPLVSIITNVQIDHTEILGDSIEEIALEKTGIIKEGVPLITAESDERALTIIRKSCEENNAPLYVIGDDVVYSVIDNNVSGQTFNLSGTISHKNLKTNLLGRHQSVNAATAVCALDIINLSGLDISENDIRSGLLSVDWPARFEVFDTKPTMILDCAHNPSGAEKLVETLTDLYGSKKMIFVLGLSDYKDVNSILKILAPKISAAVTARSNHPQAVSASLLCEKLIKQGVNCKKASSVEDAIMLSKALVKEDDIIVFSGSIFFVGDVRKKIVGGVKL